MRILTLILAFSLSTLAWTQAETTESETDTETETATQEYPQLILHTNYGAITVELFEDKAPESVANFIQYARDGHYDGTLFHRVISNFMIQGGGFDTDFNQKPTRDPIFNEADNGLANDRGTLAMARTNDPHSATSQFFINVTDNAFLDHRSKHSGQTWGYAVFGQVVDGMDVVDTIRQVPTGRQGMHADVPNEPVIIERVEIPE
ncbi:MAG: peptidylprolyl isomerase [Wenzhouxiangella sp.]|jgi:peptidyl-prolyl cis-trans isomerase B (cyclophilin B)|nr:peptidylprolyl isomerase [Wenzhouxiangella sp.]